jgi:Ca2+-binding RTX toxin-like protein
MWGNSGNDAMSGGAGNDKLSGGKGDDVLDGGDGDDVVEGNSGDDVLIDSAGNDAYVGGAGFDTLDFSMAKAGVKIDMSKGTATGNGSDTFKSVERVVGSAFADDIKGSSREDVIAGGAGDDTIRGMAGADKLSGGAGKDAFVWLAKDLGKGVDHITDFAVGDRIDLSEIVKGQAGAVRLTDGAAGVTVSVNVGGSFVDVVTLDDYHATDLVAQGLILS